MVIKKNLKKSISLFLISLIFSSLLIFSSFSATQAGQEMRTQILFLLDIITNDNNMETLVSRGEFSRMLVKASSFKDSTSLADFSTSFTDVDNLNPYAQYIRIATREGYMFAYLGGLFKPNEFITYKDLIRGCLSLLGYKNTDFKGNQISGRIDTFISLKMNKYIDDKQANDYVTKQDAVNAIYNTLKTSKKGGAAYGPSVFSKLSLTSDGELSASGLIKMTLEGPFIFRRNEGVNLNLPFELTSANIIINGVAGDMDALARELKNYEYLLYYYNKDTKTVFVYKQGTTMDSTVMVNKGYVTHIYYNSSDTITPSRVDIDNCWYDLGTDDVKFALSYAGTIRVGDQVIYVYDKSSGINSSDEGEFTSSGTISNIFIYNIRK